MTHLKAFTILENPKLEEAEKHVKEALAKRKLLVIVGSCWVNYKGRASSQLQPGERLLIIKEDGSLLVHRPTGYEPVNWQPSGCIFQTKLTGNVLQISAVRTKPRESVKIFFDKIYLLSVLSLIDAGMFHLYASEEDMQKAILAEPTIIEDGFKPIAYEKKVEPGFVDVYGVDEKGRFVVIEIKRKTVGREAVLQLAKYVKAIKSMVNREVRGILAAPDVAKNTQRLLATLKLDFKHVDPKKCVEILKRLETKKLSEFL